MKVRISLTVDIDPDAWTMNYGVEGAEAIRKDVREYVTHGVYDGLSVTGVLTTPPDAR